MTKLLTYTLKKITFIKNYLDIYIKFKSIIQNLIVFLNKCILYSTFYLFLFL